MSLQQLQDNILAIAAEELKWTIRFCVLELLYNDLELSQRNDCDGSGMCLAQSNDGYYKPKATGCNCQPIACPNCFEVVTQLVLDCKGGHCISCDMALFRNKEAFDNRRTKLNCDECLLPLDRRYHRLDYKNSNHEWVREHMHERCFYEWKLEDMSELDNRCDCDDNLNCKHI